MFCTQVVPESLRSSIYAFDRCFEGAISALSAPLVGLVAERWFHYTSSFHGSTPQQQLANATALGNGLLVRAQVSVPLQLHIVCPQRRIEGRRQAAREGCK